MLSTKSTPDEIIREAFSQGAFQVPTGVPEAVRDNLGKVQGYDDFIEMLQKDTGLDKDGAELVAGATIPSILEFFGINPDEWKLTVSPVERGKVKYGADEYNEARKFLGSWTEVGKAALMLASIGAIATAGIGTFIAGSALKAATVALKSGKGLTYLQTLFKMESLRGIKWLSVPAVVTALGTMTSFFANTQITATGDLTTYVKQGVARGEDATRKAELDALSGTIKGAFVQVPKTRATTYKTAKPKLFKGILYNGQFGSYEQFVRAKDDAITSDEDLKADIEINLAKYLATVDNNLSYSIQIKNSPSDELGIPRTGTWATLSIYLTNQFHKRVFIDEILLGPVDPFVYYPESQKVEALQYEVPKLVKFESLHPVDTYSGQERIVDTMGNKITDVLKDGTRAVAGVSITAPIAGAVGVTQEEAIKKLGMKVLHVASEDRWWLGAPNGMRGILGGTPQTIPGIPVIELTMDDLEVNKLSSLGINGSTSFANIQASDFPGVVAASLAMGMMSGATTGPTLVITPTQVTATTVGFPKQVHVLVDKLNVRSEATSQSATAGSKQLFRGDVFTAVALIEGEAVNGNNKWYKSSLGNFVWSGGTD